ncbi:hypothetical protein HK096_011323, partial [Nowakowskiella sp. JEL0078]
KTVGWEGSSVERAWRLLRECLEKIKSGECFRVVAEKILFMERSVALPLWLVEYYKKKCPEDLLRIYLKAGSVEEAGLFAISVLEQAERIKPGVPKASTRWISYTVLDQLIAALNISENEKSLAEVKSGLAKYLKRVSEESVTICEKVRY